MTGPAQEQLRQATGLPISDVETMSRVVSTSISHQRFNMLLMTVFAGAVLLLAALGILRLDGVLGGAADAAAGPPSPTAPC